MFWREYKITAPGSRDGAHVPLLRGYPESLSFSAHQDVDRDTDRLSARAEPL